MLSPWRKKNLNKQPKKFKSRAFSYRKLNNLYKNNNNLFFILKHKIISEKFVTFFVKRLKKLNKKSKNKFKIWFKLNNVRHLTKKPLNIRMGKGKGPIVGKFHFLPAGTAYCRLLYSRIGFRFRLLKLLKSKVSPYTVYRDKARAHNFQLSKPKYTENGAVKITERVYKTYNRFIGVLRHNNKKIKRAMHRYFILSVVSKNASYNNQLSTINSPVYFYIKKKKYYKYNPFITKKDHSDLFYNFNSAYSIHVHRAISSLGIPKLYIRDLKHYSVIASQNIKSLFSYTYMNLSANILNVQNSAKLYLTGSHFFNMVLCKDPFFKQQSSFLKLFHKIDWKLFRTPFNKDLKVKNKHFFYFLN